MGCAQMSFSLVDFAESGREDIFLFFLLSNLLILTVVTELTAGRWGGLCFVPKEN